jgi:hypothetical protein
MSPVLQAPVAGAQSRFPSSVGLFSIERKRLLLNHVSPSMVLHNRDPRVSHLPSRSSAIDSHERENVFWESGAPGTGRALMPFFSLA